MSEDPLEQDFKDWEDAEIENDSKIDEESYPRYNWLLITGVGVVVLGLLIRWWVRRR